MAKRVDANQSSIVQGLREFGVSVQDLHEVGHGCPDLVCGWHGKTWLFEVKMPGGTMTKDEIKWWLGWKGEHYIIHSLEEALDILTEEEW